jgi:hypothetical protein
MPYDTQSNEDVCKIRDTLMYEYTELVSRFDCVFEEIQSNVEKCAKWLRQNHETKQFVQNR